MASTAAYLARRAAQKERVRILYRRALKDTLNWAVHRHLFYDDASILRDRFEENRHVEDVDTIDRLIENAEASYNKWRHPDPYIVPWAPGGSKFTRNPTPPQGSSDDPVGSSDLQEQASQTFRTMEKGVQRIVDNPA
ncbi:NADH dehydrogenase [ubiquinone] 1 beta subcomplex subunit 9 [Mucuna pruriens]|uniref:NADH dehydrogenase [ubiquinone] 1 beta subcomplex subunit 9 n=1 Tax=Mucuna pruriens TaxID=157652 RepID=A0A371ENW5_MUCPR|nr:NADH dehydrogenase [ubiquinone] 1 beta subcomplex subunit 9 [Mucuna pruriens]